MDNKKWKKKNKPAACTKAPWEYLIPYNMRASTMRQINAECIDIYGYSYEECSKRKVCFKKECLGRPLPWKSPTAKPFLEQLKETATIKSEELVVQTDCSKCPIFNKCKNPCYQVLDFINRDKSDEPLLYYKAKTSSLDVINTDNKEMEETTKLLVGGDDIPWDCLSEQKQVLIKKYLYDQLDFKYISEQLNMTNQARAKREFYYAITKLAKFAIIREFLKNPPEELRDNHKRLLELLFVENKTYFQASKELNMTIQNSHQIVQRIVNRHNLKWNKYVTKKGNKEIFNVPKLFK